MCYKKPGLRCAIHIEPRLRSHRKRVEDRKAALKEATDSGNTASIRRLTEKLAFAESRLAAVQKEWDLTPQGIQEIRESATAVGVNAANRKRLENYVAQCEKKRAKHLLDFNASQNNVQNLRSILEQHGVSAEAIHEVEELSKKDTGSSYARASGYYAKQKEKWAAEVGHIRNEMTYAARKAESWDREAVIDAYGSKLAYAYLALREAEFAYDTCPEGLAAMTERLETDKNLAVRERAQLKARLAHCSRFHRTQLDDRYVRQQKERLIKQAMRSVGKDAAPVLKALRKNGSQKAAGARTATPSRRQDPMFTKTVEARAWMTPAEHEALQAEFKRSPEYMESGDKGFPRFVERKIMTPPSEYHVAKSVEEVNAETPWVRGTGEVGRPATTANKHDLRKSAVRTYLSPVQKRERKQWMQNYMISDSSLMRCALTGIDPRAIQNDRSGLHNAVKTEAMHEMPNGSNSKAAA